MKYLLAATSLGLLTGCISASKFDAERAFNKCESIKIPTSRDRCIAEAVSEAERIRQRQAQDQQERIEEAEARELNRVIAGAEQD